MAATLVLAVLSLVASACSSSSPPDAQSVGGDFLTALASGDAATAAKWTTDPTSAQRLLTQVRSALQPTSVTAHLGQVTTTNSTATANFTLTWQFGPNATWNDASSMTLTQDSDGNWRVRWAPAILTPRLAAGQTIVRHTVPPTAGPVIGSDGTPLLVPGNVIAVTVHAAQAGDLPSVANSLAAALNRFDPTVTPQSIIDGATKAGAAGYPVVSLRDSDYQQVKPQIYNLPGVTFGTTSEPLSPQRGFGGAILPAIRAVANQQAGTLAGLDIDIADQHGATVQPLYSKPPGTGPQLTSTISGKAQQAAEAALGTVPQQAMAVVIQPSTGDILAVAANAPALAAGDNPLTGQYPPGSTFKIVTALAALQAGTVNPNTPEACPGTTSIEGRTIPNENQFNLGTVPLITAFAQSCNTTFSQVAVGLTPAALPATAKQLGIGVDYTVPHFTTVTGSVPTDSDALARGEDGFGQGKDQVSPFGMALVAASVAHGSTPTPALLKGDTTQADTPPSPLPAQPRAALEQMMRAVVTSGTAKSIAGINPPVAGKTGTAQFGDGTNSHGWFVGYQGDLAFAFLLVGAGSSSPAVTVAGQFLTAFGG